MTNVKFTYSRRLIRSNIVVSYVPTLSFQRPVVNGDASVEQELSAPQNREYPNRPLRVRCEKMQLLCEFSLI